MLATLVQRPSVPVSTADALSGTPRAHGLDRWIFVGMATWYVVLALGGFVPSSLDKIAQVQAGVRPDFPPALHLHAVLMGAFLCTLLLQSWLMATGRRPYHMQLGLLGFALAGAVVVGGPLVLNARHDELMAMWQAAAPEGKAAAWAAVERAERIAFRGLTVFVTLFSLLMIIAFRARLSDPGLHKRLILLAVALPLSGATSRISFLPTTWGSSTLTADLYTLLVIAPLIAWDVIRNGRVHRAYLIWLALFLPATLIVNLVWDTPWWHETYRQLVTSI